LKLLQWQSLVEEEVGTYEDMMVGVDVINGHIAREWVILVIPCMVFQTKLLMCLNLKDQILKSFMEEYQDFLRYKSEKSIGQGQSSSMPSVSTASISPSMDGRSPWIIDLGALYHIFGNISLFSSFSYPKIPHVVTIANGSKVAYQGVGQFSLSPSLNFNSVLFIPHCPYILISLNQLTQSLNYFVTFSGNSFVI